MRGKIAPETFRENLWQDHDEDSLGTLQKLEIRDIKYTFYLSIAVLKSQGVPDQWHLHVYKRKLKKRERLWEKSVIASNPKPQTSNIPSLVVQLFSLVLPFWFLFLHNAPALIQKCCQSAKKTEIFSFGTEVLGNASLYFATTRLSACLKVLWKEGTDSEILPSKTQRRKSKIYLLVSL